MDMHIITSNSDLLKALGHFYSNFKKPKITNYLSGKLKWNLFLKIKKREKKEFELQLYLIFLIFQSHLHSFYIIIDLKMNRSPVSISFFFLFLPQMIVKIRKKKN